MPAGSYLGQGILGANGKPAALNYGFPSYKGVPLPAACAGPNANPVSCLAAHGYRGYLTYQPASRFWTFQCIETGIFVVLAAALLGVTFWVLKRRDA